jgi:hypothetical protein
MKDARSNLVERLDRYSTEQPDLFNRVSVKIKEKFLPKIRQGTISGTAICIYFKFFNHFFPQIFIFLLVRSHNPIFQEENAIQMVLDILSDRGFYAVSDTYHTQIPYKVDKEGNIVTKENILYSFKVQFPKSSIREIF